MFILNIRDPDLDPNFIEMLDPDPYIMEKDSQVCFKM
jgi:hypothetical protein